MNRRQIKNESERKQRRKVEDKKRNRSRKKNWMVNKESLRRKIEGSKTESKRQTRKTERES